MTTKQILLSTLILGATANNALAMENNLTQSEPRVFNEGWNTRLNINTHCYLFSSVFLRAEACNPNSHIQIVQLDEKNVSKKNTIKNKQKYTNQGTIETFQTEYNLSTKHRNKKLNRQDQFWNHTRNNNAVFCPNTQTIIHGTKNIQRCNEYAKLLAAYKNTENKNYV
jgi:hypothetical protein